MAFGKKFDKNKLKLKEKRKQQNPLFKRKKFCRFSAAHVERVDYKDVEGLKRFLDPYARIVGHRRSGVCARHQRKLTTAVKHARFLALIPFVAR